jgi:hypothetical protein
MAEHKVNNYLLGVVAVFAIFFIMWITLKDVDMKYRAASDDIIGTDAVGQAADAVLTEAQASTASIQDTSVCKLIVGQTTIYDSTTLAANLNIGGSTYYSGYNIVVKNINSNGCVISVGGNADYIAVGQIEKLGSVYVTVKEVLQ